MSTTNQDYDFDVQDYEYLQLMLLLSEPELRHQFLPTDGDASATVTNL